jgi:hypothetical protein
MESITLIDRDSSQIGLAVDVHPLWINLLGRVGERFIRLSVTSPASHAGGELYGTQIIGPRIMAVRMVRGLDLAIFPARRGIATTPTAAGVRKRAWNRFCGNTRKVELLDFSS